MKKKSVFVAVLLSLLVLPGSGQLYLGRKRTGAVILVVFLAFLGLATYDTVQAVQAVYSMIDSGQVRATPGMDWNYLLRLVQERHSFWMGDLSFMICLLLWIFAFMEILIKAYFVRDAPPAAP